MQCMKYSKIWLNPTFAALNLTFIRRQKAFPVFHADRVIIRLPACGQGQLSRVWKKQCDWLSLGKECCLRLSRRLWEGMKCELPYKRPRGRLGLMGTSEHRERLWTRQISCNVIVLASALRNSNVLTATDVSTTCAVEAISWWRQKWHHAGCGNYQQQSYSGLHSPGRTITYVSHNRKYFSCPFADSVQVYRSQWKIVIILWRVQECFAQHGNFQIWYFKFPYPEQNAEGMLLSVLERTRRAGFHRSSS